MGGVLKSRSNVNMTVNQGLGAVQGKIKDLFVGAPVRALVNTFAEHSEVTIPVGNKLHITQSELNDVKALGAANNYSEAWKRLALYGDYYAGLSWETTSHAGSFLFEFGKGGWISSGYDPNGVDAGQYEAFKIAQVKNYILLLEGQTPDSNGNRTFLDSHKLLDAYELTTVQQGLPLTVLGHAFFEAVNTKTGGALEYLGLGYEDFLGSVDK